jgi:hypothetical protein
MNKVLNVYRKIFLFFKNKSFKIKPNLTLFLNISYLKNKRYSSKQIFPQNQYKPNLPRARPPSAGGREFP